MFATFDDSHEPRAHIDEYSETNIEFHQRHDRTQQVRQLLKSKSRTGCFMHMRAIRRKTIGERDRATEIHHRSHAHHPRPAKREMPRMAEQLVREHAMHLANHIKQYVDYLD